MAINFPSSPIDNQSYTSGGITWFWSNTVQAWQTTTSAASIVSANPPSSPTSGNLWWNSNTGGLYIYYNDGNSSQWVEASPRLPPFYSPFGYSIIFGGF